MMTEFIIIDANMIDNLLTEFTPSVLALNISNSNKKYKK